MRMKANRTVRWGGKNNSKSLVAVTLCNWKCLLKYICDESPSCKNVWIIWLQVLMFTPWHWWLLYHTKLISPKVFNFFLPRFRSAVVPTECSVLNPGWLEQDIQARKQTQQWGEVKNQLHQSQSSYLCNWKCTLEIYLWVVSATEGCYWSSWLQVIKFTLWHWSLLYHLKASQSKGFSFLPAKVQGSCVCIRVLWFGSGLVGGGYNLPKKEAKPIVRWKNRLYEPRSSHTVYSKVHAGNIFVMSLHHGRLCWSSGFRFSCILLISDIDHFYITLS